MNLSASTAAIAPARRRVARPGAGGALGVAGMCLLALAAVWVVAQLVPAAHIRDAAALRDFTQLDRAHVDTAASALIHLLNPLLLSIWGLTLVLLAIARDRPRIALAVAVVLALAPLSADWLKPLLAHAHARAGTVQINAASWPSGHSAAALALALCAVLVSPRRFRLVVGAAGAVFALAVGSALLIRAWHMPSDVLGGYLIAALWMALAVAALRAADRRWPPGRAEQQHAVDGGLARRRG